MVAGVGPAPVPVSAAPPPPGDAGTAPGVFPPFIAELEPPGYESFTFGPGPHTLTVDVVQPTVLPDALYVCARFKVRL